MSKHVVIPDEREAQLRQIAKVHNVSVASAIGLLIGWAIESGKVAPGFPDIKVERQADMVTIDFGDFKKVMNVELASAFATCLSWFAMPKRGAAREVSELLSGANLVGISRRGMSVKIAAGDGAERTLANSVAQELATEIKRVAA